jgi:hypothetical protein
LKQQQNYPLCDFFPSPFSYTSSDGAVAFHTPKNALFQMIIASDVLIAELAVLAQQVIPHPNVSATGQ